MSENTPGDDRDPQRGRQGQIGLSVPREEAAQRSTTTRPRRRPGGAEKFQQAARVDPDVVGRWFLPVTVLLLVLLVIVAIVTFAQGSRLEALQRQVAALNEQVVESGPDTRLRQLSERVETLGDRLDSTGGPGAEIEALRGTLVEQSEKIQALSDRLAGLEQGTGGGSGSSDTGGASGEASPAASGDAGGGSWVINLITVADQASAEAFQKRLEKLDVDSRIQSVTVEDKPLLRVVVPGFQSRDAAENAGAEMKRELELPDDPWITRE